MRQTFPWRSTLLRSIPATLPFLTSALWASPVWSQDDELTPPPTWELRLDSPDRGSVEDIWYVDMPPGWHITTGPAAIFWDPATAASGDFRIESEIFLFDPEGRREGFGFFFGGSDLKGPEQSYTYFLLREGGEFIVKHREGDEARTLIPWTHHPSIVSFATKPEDAHTARNVLAVEVGDGTVRFFVNDTEVASLPRDDLPTAGTVGLRVNHSVNLHITMLDITQR